MDELFFPLLITAVFFCVLYCVIKAAVKNAILEAREHSKDGPPKRIMITCPTCAGEYEFGCPACPHCKNLSE